MTTSKYSCMNNFKLSPLSRCWMLLIPLPFRSRIIRLRSHRWLIVPIQMWKFAGMSSSKSVESQSVWNIPLQFITFLKGFFSRFFFLCYVKGKIIHQSFTPCTVFQKYQESSLLTSNLIDLLNDSCTLRWTLQILQCYDALRLIFSKTIYFK